MTRSEMIATLSLMGWEPWSSKTKTVSGEQWSGVANIGMNKLVWEWEDMLTEPRVHSMSDLMIKSSIYYDHSWERLTQKYLEKALQLSGA